MSVAISDGRSRQKLTGNLLWMILAALSAPPWLIGCEARTLNHQLTFFFFSFFWGEGEAKSLFPFFYFLTTLIFTTTEYTFTQRSSVKPETFSFVHSSFQKITKDDFLYFHKITIMIPWQQYDQCCVYLLSSELALCGRFLLSRSRRSWALMMGRTMDFLRLLYNASCCSRLLMHKQCK